MALPSGKIMQIPLLFKKNEFLTRPVHLKQAFSRVECENMKAALKSAGGGPSTSKGGVKSLLVRPNNPLILNKLNSIFLYINENFYNFDLSDIREISFLEYQEGSYMKWHTDIGKPLDEKRAANYHTRKITLSLLLSDKKDFEGGNLLFRPDFPLTIDQGDVVGYPSYLLHSVEPLTRGERFVLLVSANGPTFH
jgi:predicted 2-oxoglutarate/Fe(II)-dependent dioxygenase YbiX